MATSSITHNFVIRGAAVEAFVRAIDESEAVKDSIPLEPAPGHLITTPEEFRELMEKRQKRKGVNVRT